MYINEWVSVIIPCYNAWEYLSDAIESIKTHLAWSIYEIIVSDDWSNDDWNTDNVLDFYSWQKWIKILKHSKNRWTQFVRNKGLDKVSYSYVFMLDSDDLLNNSNEVLMNWNYPQNAINILQNNDIWFVHSSSKMFWGFNWYTISPYKLNEELILMKHHVSTHMVYRIDDAIKWWIYNEDIKKWQDWSAWVWLLNFRFKSSEKNYIEFLDRPYYLYREHSSVYRLSLWNVDELDMILKTVKLYPDIFQKYYPNLNEEEIAKKVFLSKPSKLKDLFYIANLNDINLARIIVKERWWIISWNVITLEELLIISLKKWVNFAMSIVNEYNLELQTNSELWNIP